MVEVPLRISSPRKVKSPSHTFNPGQFWVLASYLQFPIKGAPPTSWWHLVVPTFPLFGRSLYW